MAATRASYPSRWLAQSKFRKDIRHFNLLDVAGSANGASAVTPLIPLEHITVPASAHGVELLRRQASGHQDMAVTILQPNHITTGDASESTSHILEMLDTHSGSISELAFSSSLSSPLIAREVLSNLPSMHRLTAMSIDGGRLGSAGLAALSDATLQAKHLRCMHIGSSHVSVDSLGPLFEQLAYLGHFESFEASDLLPGADVEGMTSILQHLPWLESLHFSECFFSPEQVQELGTAAGQCQRLQSLQLRNCGLEAASGALLRRGLQQAPVLSMLDVSHNQAMGSKGVADLADGVQMMHMLHSLDAAHSCAGQEGVEAIAFAVKASRGLRDVQVGDDGANLDVKCLAEAVQTSSSSLHPWHGVGVSAETAIGLEDLVASMTASNDQYATGQPVLSRLALDVNQAPEGLVVELAAYLQKHSDGLQALALRCSSGAENIETLVPLIEKCHSLQSLELAGQFASAAPSSAVSVDAAAAPLGDLGSDSRPSGEEPESR